MNEVVVSTFVSELADPEQLESLLQYIRKYAVAIWIAPSCGTASRARERPMPGRMRGPLPLSLDRPDQLDGLSGVDKIKVE